MSERPNDENVFEERLSGLFAPDVYRFALPLLLLGGIAWGLSWTIPSLVLSGLGLFVVAFFRNPERALPPGDDLVIAPADGKVMWVDELERDGRKVLRIGIFLSVFDVHVNRAPVPGRVVSIDRSGDVYLAAFNPDGEARNVQLAMGLETAWGRIDVVQITGLIARRIVFQPEVGDWLDRGVRYGLIRFGSRTDVHLPQGSMAKVAVGDVVRGGKTILAMLPEASP